MVEANRVRKHKSTTNRYDLTCDFVDFYSKEKIIKKEQIEITIKEIDANRDT